MGSGMGKTRLVFTTYCNCASIGELSLRPDDGFRHPEDEPDLPYVSWQQAHAATVSYLHGALHLFDRGSEITKYTWSKTDRAIVDQIREALDEDRYPLFVAEGTTDSKLERIMHNAYLHKALEVLRGVAFHPSMRLSSSVILSTTTTRTSSAASHPVAPAISS